MEPSTRSPVRTLQETLRQQTGQARRLGRACLLLVSVELIALAALLIHKGALNLSF
jgi:hypothetical protein